jgi:hypothetical protein
MAQPGNFTPILLYGSSTPSNAPSAANLTNNATGSEIAINVADKNLFFKDSGGTVNTVPIRQSSTSSNGWLSSTDWNTFNSKAPATSGTSILYGNGTGGFSNVTIGSGISFAGGTLSATGTGGTVTSVAALTLGTTGTDLSSTVANGTTTPVITLNVPTASAANRGALSAADWSTFNGKQAALVSGTNIKTVGGVSLLGSGDVGTIGVAYGGTGLTSLTAKYIPFGNGTSAFGSSSNFVWDNANGRLGIGFSSPTAQLEIAGYPNATLKLSDGGSGSYTFSRQAGDGYFHNVDDSGSYGFIWASGANEIMRMFASRGVSIGNTTDPGVGSLYVTNKVISGTALFNTTSNLGFPTVLDGLAASGSNGVFTFKNDAGNNQWLGWMWNNAAGATSNNLFISFGTDSSYTGRGSITYNSTAGLLSFNTTSDQRLKTNIVDAPSALDKINAIRIRSFNWIETGNHNDFGVIAQELIEVAPEAVTPGDNAKQGQVQRPWSVDTSALNPAMIKAIQELTAKVTALEEQVLNLSVK